MTELRVKPKIDVAFKKIFENEERLKHLLAATLNLKKISRVILKPTEITPHKADEKFCRLDIRAEADGREVDIEIQVGRRDDFRARLEYYSSLLFSHLGKGKNYNELAETIVICFIDDNIFGCNEYHSEFVTMERTRCEVLTEKKITHVFELKKIPRLDLAQNTLEYWLSFIKAETAEDIQALEKLPCEHIKEAVSEVYRLNEDEEFSRNVAGREVSLREERSAMAAAEQTGREEIIRMLENGMTLDEIKARVTAG
jgi:predicted transposase/invertase (TIGR01784 family)